MRIVFDIVRGILRKSPAMKSRLKQKLAEQLIKLINSLG